MLHGTNVKKKKRKNVEGSKTERNKGNKVRILLVILTYLLHDARFWKYNISDTIFYWRCTYNRLILGFQPFCSDVVRNVICSTPRLNWWLSGFFFFYLQPARCNYFWLFISKTLYMFRAVPPPNIRAQNRKHGFRYCQPILLLASVVAEMELTSDFQASSISATILVSSSTGWQNLKLN